ncbi:type II toxin-antitoxin system prevent-host-death family antitoxin [uncultured Psychrobacter sp.]|uniref:type II toxin-antitoxin system Phd/YefM family antitoxin n=1 Tax=uncultured Psychrobacter sp. TaxID=259303 RepID=UPI0026066A68|nr:type II toxin-antitoxin system prevent-host-death family antitoxin [uncultured Psychrobacter sp.]
MKRISLSKAKKDFEAVLDTVNYNDGPIIIGRQNNNDAVIMSLAHYNGLMETLYLLKSSANAAHLAKSVEQYESSKLNSKTK